jgi:hypothetical protein
MKTKKKNSLLAAALPFVLCAEFLLVAGQATSLYATALASPAPQNQSQDTPSVSTYTGKIMSQNGVRFILRDVLAQRDIFLGSVAYLQTAALLCLS